MKKRLGILFLTVLLLGTLLGCQFRQGFSDEDKVQELKVITTFAGEDGNAQIFKDAVGAFEESTGILVIDQSSVSTEEFKARVETDFQAGSEPDVLFFFSGADASNFIREGKVVSIEDIRKLYPEYASNMNEDLIMPSLVDGRKYSVPVNGFWEGMFCNTAVLKKCGVEVPGKGYTWEKFLEDCEKIKQAGYIPIAAALGDLPHYWWETCIFNHTTPETHLEIPVNVSMGNGPAWVAGMEDIKDLYSRGYFPSNTLSTKDDDTFAMFTGDRAAFLIDGSWKVGSIVSSCQSDPTNPATLDEEKLSRFTVTYPPTMGNRKSTDLIGGLSMGYYITQKAWEDEETREAAVRFVEYMTSDNMVTRFSKNSISALKTRPLMNREHSNSLERKVTVMLDEVTSLTGAVQDVFSGECRKSTFDGMPQIVTGDVSPKDAVSSGLSVYASENKK